jgi:hypothetical protein
MPDNTYRKDNIVPIFPFILASPAVAAALFAMLMLDIIVGVPRSRCNSILKILRHGTAADPIPSSIRLPKDVRTIRKICQVSVQTTEFASCPSCSTCYAPTFKGNIPIYPRKCTSRRFQSSVECGTQVTKSGVLGNYSIRVPIKPFVVQDFNAYIARLLSQSDVLGCMKKSAVSATPDVIYDVKDGSAIRELPGPDGLPFLNGGGSNELRLVFALSVDGFNPFHLKQSGKSVSVSHITMSCLNLPPHIRNKPENLYLAAIIPGPSEPPTTAINHYMAPIVDMLLHSWRHGTWFQVGGFVILVRCAVACLVADLPAARRVGGMASHSANKFCSLCELKKGERSNLHPESWPMRSFDKLVSSAEQWRDADNEVAQVKLFQRTGVRWSELLKLPHWDPTKHVVVDGMHNLLLGLAQYHIRKLLGVGQHNPKSRKNVGRSKRSASKSAGRVVGESDEGMQRAEVQVGGDSEIMMGTEGDETTTVSFRMEGIFLG